MNSLASDMIVWHISNSTNIVKIVISLMAWEEYPDGTAFGWFAATGSEVTGQLCVRLGTSWKVKRSGLHGQPWMLQVSTNDTKLVWQKHSIPQRLKPCCSNQMDKERQLNVRSSWWFDFECMAWYNLNSSTMKWISGSMSLNVRCPLNISPLSRDIDDRPCPSS